MTNTLALAISLISCLLIRECHAYRILAICPTPANSHQLVFHLMVETLAERGHELVVITAKPTDLHGPNVTQIELTRAFERRLATENYFQTRGMRIIMLGLEDFPKLIDQALAEPKVQALIHNPNETFDAVLSEFVGYTPFYAFAQLFDAPLIGFTSLQIDATQHEALGNSVHPAIHNPNLMGFYRGSSLYRRAWNTVCFLYGSFLKVLFFAKFDNIIDKHFGESMMRSSELQKSVDLLFLQQNPLLGSVRPMLPNIITTSFLHIRPTRPLPKELKSCLDNSPQGAIYFSLGTMVLSDHMDDAMLETFKSAFGGMKYTVLWKREKAVSNHTGSNIVTAPWFPQQDLFDHHNLRLFITQGGLQSMEEAISRGVPMVVIPFFYDQFDNAEIIEEKQIGVQLDRDSLTPRAIQEAVEEVMHNPKYRRNILRLQQAIQDEPLTPREKVSWWVEYVIRHREEMKSMRYPELPFWQKYFLDVSGIFIALVFAIVGLLKLGFSSIRWVVCGRRKPLVKNKIKCS